MLTEKTGIQSKEIIALAVAEVVALFEKAELPIGNWLVLRVIFSIPRHCLGLGFWFAYVG